ncbi:MAG: GNAT family N-acetyltransferase [Clostridia bacterium]|nr:GNAT family N-acetyltransferase [Clostridia bacterium]
MQEITVRVADVKDAPALLALYAPYVTQTAVTFEYQVPSAEEFERRISETLQRFPYLVAEADGEIVGYAYAHPFKPRPAYGWSVETTVYVRSDCKRSGVGRTLYAELERLLAAQNICTCNACITRPAEENDPYLTNDSERFHERVGYRLVGQFTRCGYKFGRWYHMIWMEKHIGEHLAPQPAVIPFAVLRKQLGI